MKKRNKIILGIVLSLLSLLLVLDTVVLWIFVEIYRDEHTVIDLSHGIYMSALLNSDEEALARDSYYDYVRDILMDDPNIFQDEPAILLVNPSIKPLVARVFAEESSVLECNLNTVSLHSDLLELEPALADRVKEMLDWPGDSYPSLRKLVQ